MNRFSMLAYSLVSVVALAAATSSQAQVAMSASQIVDKNIAARGGLSAWHAVQTLTMEGTLDAGGKVNHALPFVMKLKRSHKSRLEIVFNDQASVQVYDGNQGWKVRPFLNRNEVEPYTKAEANSAAATDELDGPLVDYAAKGTKVALVGNESVEGMCEVVHTSGGPRFRPLDLWMMSGCPSDSAPRGRCAEIERCLIEKKSRLFESRKVFQ